MVAAETTRPQGSNNLLSGSSQETCQSLVCVTLSGVNGELGSSACKGQWVPEGPEHVGRARRAPPRFLARGFLSAVGGLGRERRDAQAPFLAEMGVRGLESLTRCRGEFSVPVVALYVSPSSPRWAWPDRMARIQTGFGFRFFESWRTGSVPKWRFLVASVFLSRK